MAEPEAPKPANPPAAPAPAPPKPAPSKEPLRAPEPAPPPAPVIPPAPKFFGVVVAGTVLAAVVGVTSYFVPSLRISEITAPPKAAITLDGGTPVAATYPAGTLLALSAEKATANSVYWTVSPAQTQTYQLANRLLVTTLQNGPVSIQQFAVKGGKLDTAAVTFTVAGAANPVNPPVPLPEPPPGSFDPEVRRLAAAYFASYPANYAQVADAADYDTGTNTVKSSRSTVGTPLGQRIDTLVAPLHNGSSWTADAAARKRVYSTISNSLLAGQRDAVLAALKPE